MTVTRPLPVRVLAVLLAALAALWLPAYAAAVDEVAFTIKDQRITESSGLATDADRRALLDRQRLRRRRYRVRDERQGGHRGNGRVPGRSGRRRGGRLGRRPALPGRHRRQPGRGATPSRCTSSTTPSRTTTPAAYRAYDFSLPRRAARRRDAAGRRRRAVLHRHQGSPRAASTRRRSTRPGRASTSSSGSATRRRSSPTGPCLPDGDRSRCGPTFRWRSSTPTRTRSWRGAAAPAEAGRVDHHHLDGRPC